MPMQPILEPFERFFRGSSEFHFFAWFLQALAWVIHAAAWLYLAVNVLGPETNT